jgi:mannose-6-phosphate isomerase-like protein (cupin superfamily)
MPGNVFGLRVKVFDTPSLDGQISGTPHVHLVCRELYFVLNGYGFVEIIDQNGFAKLELKPNSILIFNPGTIHRLINPDRTLELFVLEQSGLPEFGDNIACFNPYWMESDERFTQIMKVENLDQAYQRRNHAVEGFIQIKQAFQESAEQGRIALEQFYLLAIDRSQSFHQKWQEVVKDGALSEAEETLDAINTISNRKLDNLFASKQLLINANDYTGLGCCGYLNRYFNREQYLPDGIVAGVK